MSTRLIDGLSRRRLLRGTLVADATAILTMQANAQVLDKAAVNYKVERADGQRCGNCARWVEGGTCTIVKGDIAPEAWCAIWAPGD